MSTNNIPKVTPIYYSDLKVLQPVRMAAYARVSSSKDAAEDSLANQVEHYISYISNHPNTQFAGIYADNGISGTLTKRPEFQRLLEDCRARKVDKIVTKSITRFSRNTVLLLEALRELKALGVDVYFEKENIHTLDQKGELILTALAIYAEMEAKSASDSIIWIIERGFRQGIPTYSRPYGYKMVGKKFEIIPEEAAVIRRIFQDYLDGVGTMRIAKNLTAEHIKPMNHGVWSVSSITTILNNEKYTGDLLLQKTFRENYLTKRKIYNRGEKAQYYVQSAHEPIVSQETFDAVQAKLAANSHRYKTANKPTKNPDYLFTDFIICGNCGSKFIHKANHRHHTEGWSCYTYQSKGKSQCHIGVIPNDILVDKTEEVLGTDNLTREILEQRITKIVVPDHHKLLYYLTSGEVVTAEWQNHSRRDSWTPEMKEMARKKSLARISKEVQNA